MKEVTLKVTVNADVSDETLSDIIGNIGNYIYDENKFWKELGVLNEGDSVDADVLIEDLTKEARDLRNRISKLAEMSHELCLIAEKHNDYSWDDHDSRVEAMESEYQDLFTETVKKFGGVVLIPEGHAFCDTCDTHTAHRWTKVGEMDMSRCIPCYEG